MIVFEHHTRRKDVPPVVLQNGRPHRFVVFILQGLPVEQMDFLTVYEVYCLTLFERNGRSVLVLTANKAAVPQPCFPYRVQVLSGVVAIDGAKEIVCEARHF